jgi:hypothetical protein
MTTTGTGKLFHSNDTDPSSASFPAITMPDPPKIVALTAAGKTAILKGKSRPGAENDQIRVAKGCLTQVVDGTSCTFAEASLRRFRIYWLRHDPTKQRALVGFGLGIVGLALDLALGIGKVVPIIIVGETGIVATMVLGGVLKAVGLALVFLAVYTSDS